MKQGKAERTLWGLAQVGRLVRASSQYAKVEHSLFGQGTDKKQPMSA